MREIRTSGSAGGGGPAFGWAAPTLLFVFLRVRVIDPGVFVAVFAGGESPASATCSSS